jgi:hypothetical protein
MKSRRRIQDIMIIDFPDRVKIGFCDRHEYNHMVENLVYIARIVFGKSGTLQKALLQDGAIRRLVPVP